MKKNNLIYAFFFGILFLPAVYAENSITTFDNDWAFSFFSNFNRGTFAQSGTAAFSSKPIWDIGMGIRYKKISASVSFPVPAADSSVAEPSFDFEFVSYLDKIYFDAYFKYYRDYHGNSDEPCGLDTLVSGIAATFVQNYRDHSMSSVNELNKRQNISSGSFLYSLGAYYSSLNNYDEKQKLLYCGPGFGYSYIWIFRSGLFMNASLVFFANAGYNISTDKWLFIPHLEPNLVFGYHRDTWSANIKVMNKTTVVDESYDLLTLTTITCTFSKRF
jgi:hypothetical protein